MTIADHALHRSGRAALPHPAPASGDDTESLVRPGVADVRRGQEFEELALGELRDAVLLATSLERTHPEPTDAAREGLHPRDIVGHAVVAEVPAKDRLQVGPLLWDGVVHAAPQLGLQLGELGAHLR